MNSIKKITFQSPINIDNGFTSTYQGDFTSTKELFADDEQTPSLIEWEVEDFATEHIGLQVEGKAVTGYDGVFDLPEQAIQMLEELGYDCTEVKRPDTRPTKQRWPFLMSKKRLFVADMLNQEQATGSRLDR
ncbi:MAG: hypothetical protein BGO53_11885 [Sphingobacteriales bacterium 39-19]|nr:hypothetical protein [Sphingobacteriales bacterium]OJW11626.1 MAG: hypothetical protein BGO53_11885 [Sphingobacteriales bacterium 39-19]